MALARLTRFARSQPNDVPPFINEAKWAWLGSCGKRELVFGKAANTAAAAQSLGFGGVGILPSTGGNGDKYFPSIDGSSTYSVIVICANVNNGQIRNPFDGDDQTSGTRIFQLRINASNICEFIGFNTSGSPSTATGGAVPVTGPVVMIGVMDAAKKPNVYCTGSSSGQGSALSGTVRSIIKSSRLSVGERVPGDQVFTGPVYSAYYVDRAFCPAEANEVVNDAYGYFFRDTRTRIWPASGSSGTAPGATLTGTASLSAGAAAGDAAASGATLTGSASLSGGTASGAATASGSTLTGTASLSSGAGTGDGAASGASMTGGGSLSSGSAAGDAAAAGASLTGTASLSAGSASGSGSSTASGANLTGTGSLAAGAATGDASATGASVAGSGSLAAGGASGQASASGATLTGTASLSAGAAGQAAPLVPSVRFSATVPARSFAALVPARSFSAIV